MKRIILILFATFFVCSTLFAQKTSRSTLPQVFDRISSLDGFQILSPKEIEDIMGVKLGKCKGTIHGNASHREKVLNILSNLPKSSLYSEYRTSNNKITRVYIEKDTMNYMLYTFIGIGGNDLVVLLYMGGDLVKYKKIGDSIK